MLLRFFKNREGDLHTYTSVADIFNPLINKYWWEATPPSGETSNTSGLTVTRFWDLIKTIYSPTNLINHPDLIQGMYHNIPNPWWAGVAQKIINALPVDKLWILNFICIDSLTYNPNSVLRSDPPNGRIQISVYSAQPRMTLYENDFVLRYDDNFFNVTIGIDSPEWAEHFKTFMTSIITRLETLYTAHGDKLYHHQNTRPYHALPKTLIAMAMGHVYISVQNGSPLPAAVLAENPNLRISSSNSGISEISGYSIRAIMPAVLNDRRALKTVMSYSANPMDFIIHPIKQKNEIDPVLYGVELECSTDYQVDKIIDAMDVPFMIAKSDSSISGNKRNRCELVTVPMSFKAHKKEWAKWFSKLDYEKFDTSKDTNNGLHVHIGKKHFDGPKHIQRLAWFINNPANNEFMVELSERNQASIDNFSPIARYNTGHTSKVHEIKRIVDTVGGMRGACNVRSNKPTIEIRLFRGIVSYAAVLKNLECVDAMFHFTREYPITKMNLRTFVNWLFEQPINKYPVFKKFVEGIKNLDSILNASDMFDIIFTSANPEDITRKLDKAGIKISNDHVTILNRKAKKRVYVLNKATNKLEVARTNQFVLSHLDRKLEARYVGR